jgi:hypothetical protein
MRGVVDIGARKTIGSQWRGDAERAPDWDRRGVGYEWADGAWWADRRRRARDRVPWHARGGRGAAAAPAVDADRARHVDRRGQDRHDEEPGVPPLGSDELHGRVLHPAGTGQRIACRAGDGDVLPRPVAWLSSGAASGVGLGSGTAGWGGRALRGSHDTPPSRRGGLSSHHTYAGLGRQPLSTQKGCVVSAPPERPARR